LPDGCVPAIDGDTDLGIQIRSRTAHECARLRELRLDDADGLIRYVDLRLEIVQLWIVEQLTIGRGPPCRGVAEISSSRFP
jgi:hypothetical protein